MTMGLRRTSGPPGPYPSPLAGLLPPPPPADPARLRRAADAAIRRARAASPEPWFGMIATPWALAGLAVLALASGFAGYYAPPGEPAPAAASPLALLLSAPFDLGML